MTYTHDTDWNENGAGTKALSDYTAVLLRRRVTVLTTFLLTLALVLLPLH